MNEEGYRLQVTAKGVVIKAKTGKGAFYGMQTSCSCCQRKWKVLLW